MAPENSVRPAARGVRRCLLVLLLLGPAPAGRAQLPADDPRAAQLRWYERARERPDLVKGAFEVLRFPTGYTFTPRYRHEPRRRKRILNPDFHCNQCVREKRIPPPGDRSARRLMQLDEPQVLAWMGGKLKIRRYTFIEDGTFKLFMDLPGINLKKFPNPFRKEELRELGDVFPEVTEKTVAIDGHKRAHLYLIRAHRLLRDFWWLVGTTNAEVRKRWPWLGPYMGMKGKQEIFVFRKRRSYTAFADRFIGRISPDGQCWHHFIDRAMVMLMHADGHEDPQTRNFFFHRLMHNLLDAYRMYAFKLPAWFQMGLGHWVERREDSHYDTFCFSEGTIPRVLHTSKWLPRVKKMVLKDDVMPFVQAASRKEYGEFPPRYHMVSWSWVCYLFRLGPEKMKVFINTLKDKTPEESLYDVQVRAFKKAYGLTLLQFDEGWRLWVRRVYPDV